MKTNLQFSVQKLTDSEMVNTNGGFIGNLLLGLLISAIIDSIDHPDDFKQGANKGADLW